MAAWEQSLDMKYHMVLMIRAAGFDHEGNLVNWWTEEDKERFDALKEKLVAQFDNYEALPGLNVQGELTLGENIGDLGGLNAAYDALQIHLKENGNPGKIDGFTPEQRFFLSWATIWRTKYRDEYLRTAGAHRSTQSGDV